MPESEFGIDMSPLPGDGVSDETIGKMKLGLAALDDQLEILAADEKIVDGQVAEMASWANAVQGIVTTALGVAQTYMQNHPSAPAAPHPSKVGTFLSGVLGAATLPKADRQGAIVGLLQGLVGGV